MPKTRKGFQIRPKTAAVIAGVLVLCLVIGIAGNAILGGGSRKKSSDSATAAVEEQKEKRDKKITKNKRYKEAYEEEYNSFNARIEQSIGEDVQERLNTIEELSQEISDIYGKIEKENPEISSQVGAVAGSMLTNNQAGAALIGNLAGKALGNAEIRQLGLEGFMVIGYSLFSWAMNYTSTDYPFGMSVVTTRGEYGILKSNGSLRDMLVYLDNMLLISRKKQVAEDAIYTYENGQDSREGDEFAEYQGRIDANKDRLAETEEMEKEFMTVILCNGAGFFTEDESDNGLWIYQIVNGEGDVQYSFWSSLLVRRNGTLDMEIAEDGSCYITSAHTKRMVISPDGEILFEGNNFELRDKEAEGESILCCYSTSGKALMERKERDSKYGTYYIYELTDRKGKTQELFRAEEVKEVNADYYYNNAPGGQCISWRESLVPSDFARVEYKTLEHETVKAVIDLTSGKVYDEKSFDEEKLAEYHKSFEENREAVDKHQMKDGWIWTTGNKDKIRVLNTYIDEDNSFGAARYPAYGEIIMEGNGNGTSIPESVAEFIRGTGETREIKGCYYKDDVLWIVTQSGYFYTYDMKNHKKLMEEIDIKENTYFVFTPYGLLLSGPNESGVAEVEYDSYKGADNHTEYSVYQYDEKGNVLAKYPYYGRDHQGIVNFYDNVYYFMYSDGKDTFSLITKEPYRVN